jgi:ABC-type amino acid transport substrate-binding protein
MINEMTVARHRKLTLINFQRQRPSIIGLRSMHPTVRTSVGRRSRVFRNESRQHTFSQRIMKNGIAISAALLAFAFVQIPVHAQKTAAPSETRELVVGTKITPPFAMRADDGTWHGISIDLWKRIATQLHLQYRFQETTVEGLTEEVADGSLDLAVAALTVTAPRLRAVDFTVPFYSTGLGIAVVSDASISWWPLVRSIFSLGFFRAIGALIAISAFVGIVLWLVERRHNEHFGRHRRGLGFSLWWSAVAMTQGGGAAGEKVPTTLPGRILAIVWMVVSVIVIASFTATLSSALTVSHLRGRVHDEADLRYVRVAAISGTETTEYLDREQIAHKDFPDLKSGLAALRRSTVDALVYDRPMLLWLVNKEFFSSLRVLDTTFDPQVYAIALPPGGNLRTPINLALIEAVRSDWWRDTLFAYLGPATQAR